MGRPCKQWAVFQNCSFFSQPYEAIWLFSRCLSLREGMKIKSWQAQNLCKEFLLLSLLIGCSGCVLFFKALIWHVGKSVTFFKPPLVLKYLPTSYMLSFFAHVCNLEPLSGREPCSWLKKKKTRHLKWYLLSLAELILHRLFRLLLTFNQKSRNLTLRMWVLGSWECKVSLLLSDQYTMYFGSELIVSIWNKEIFSELGAFTTFLWGTCWLPNRAQQLT